MPSLLRNFLDHKRTRQFTDVRNISLYIFTVIIVAITWSGVKTVQTNYELQKKISTLRQQNTITELQNGNTALQNQYYKTDQYLELAARQQLGLAAPGESVLLVPETVAKRYIDPNIGPMASATQPTSQKQSKLVNNLETWRDFLLGHKLSSD